MPRKDRREYFREYQQRPEARERKRERDREYHRKMRLLRKTVKMNAAGAVTGRSETYVPERRPFERIPNTAVIRRSALLDAENNIIQQWVIERPEDAARAQALQAFVEGLKAEVPRAEPSPAPAFPAPDLLAAYPVGDHHMGMLAWKHEVGISYDIDIGERLLKRAFTHLLNSTPACEHAILPFLGDFLHYDSHAAVTPANNNLLDADGRFQKMISAASRTMRWTIEAALCRHARVQVIVEIGNHDIVGSAWAAELLRACYEREPRVTVDIAPGHYHYYRFGKVLIGTHHGHESKPEKLGEIMAVDRASDWGETQHRYWWTGHVHSKSVYDGRGWSAESFRILPPTDAWAYNAGYRSTREMQAIVLHKEYGEVSRVRVSPAMLEDRP